MKKLFFLLSLFVCMTLFSGEKVNQKDETVIGDETWILEEVDSSVDKKDCKCKNIPLKGKVKVVDAFPDLKVQIVSSFADIHVKKVNHFPDKCGKWQFVDAFPDFTIMYVDAFPDVKIKFVDNFPGMK